MVRGPFRTSDVGPDGGTAVELAEELAEELAGELPDELPDEPDDGTAPVFGVEPVEALGAAGFVFVAQAAAVTTRPHTNGTRQRDFTGFVTPLRLRHGQVGAK